MTRGEGVVDSSAKFMWSIGNCLDKVMNEFGGMMMMLVRMLVCLILCRGTEYSVDVGVRGVLGMYRVTRAFGVSCMSQTRRSGGSASTFVLRTLTTSKPSQAHTRHATPNLQDYVISHPKRKHPTPCLF